MRAIRQSSTAFPIVHASSPGRLWRCSGSGEATVSTIFLTFSSGGMTETNRAVAKRTDIAAAIQAADTAVEAPDGASGDEDADAVVADIAAAKKEVAEVEGLSAGAKSAFEGSIRPIRGRLALAGSRIAVAREERRRRGAGPSAAGVLSPAAVPAVQLPTLPPCNRAPCPTTAA